MRQAVVMVIIIGDLVITLEAGPPNFLQAPKLLVAPAKYISYMMEKGID